MSNRAGAPGHKYAQRALERMRGSGSAAAATTSFASQVRFQLGAGRAASASAAPGRSPRVRVPVRRSNGPGSSPRPSDRSTPRVRVRIRRSSGTQPSPVAPSPLAAESTGGDASGLPPDQGPPSPRQRAGPPGPAARKRGGQKPASPQHPQPHPRQSKAKPRTPPSVRSRLSSATTAVRAGAKRAVQAVLPFRGGEGERTASSTKRGPTRSRKSDAATVSAAAATAAQSAPTERGPSRPRKSDAPPKRGTGRPRKSDAPPKRGTGRPRKSDASPVEKRGPARPRKSAATAKLSDADRVPTPPPYEPALELGPEAEAEQDASPIPLTETKRTLRQGKRKGPIEKEKETEKGARKRTRSRASEPDGTMLDAPGARRGAKAFRKRLRTATRLLASESEDEEGAMAAAEAGLRHGRRRQSVAARLTDADVMWALVDGELKEAVRTAPSAGLGLSLRAVRSLVREQFRVLSAKATRRRQMIAHYERARAYQRQLRQDVFARRRIVLDLRREVEVLKKQRAKEKQANQSASEGLAYLRRLAQGSSLWT